MTLQIPSINKYCTCTDEFYVPTRLGIHQQQYEKLKLGSTNKTTKEILTQMGIVRLCCREGIFNPPILFLNSENEGKMRDEVNLMSSDSASQSSKKKAIGFYVEDSPEIVPKKPLPPL